MKTFAISCLMSLSLLLLTINAEAQTNSDSQQKKYQARPPKTQPIMPEAFENSDHTTIHWLGMAGFLLNSRGSTFMIDPVLGEFDMPLLIDFPIKAEDIPGLDAVFITHADNDHFSVPVVKTLSRVSDIYHSTVYVDSLMKNMQLSSVGHGIGDTFCLNNISVKLTPANHAYQNAYPGMSDRVFKNEDACGFWFDTPDGTIWATGDSRLMPEHLAMPEPDVIFFDFSDNEWHFTFEGAVKLANIYPNAELLLCHWGTVDAPDFDVFNGDPAKLMNVVVNPERIRILAPGEPFILKKKK